MHRRQSYFSTYLCLFNCQRKNKKIIYVNLYRNTINDGDSQTSPLPIFPAGVGTSVHRLSPWYCIYYILEQLTSRKSLVRGACFFALYTKLFFFKANPSLCKLIQNSRHSESRVLSVKSFKFKKSRSKSSAGSVLVSTFRRAVFFLESSSSGCRTLHVPNLIPI